MVKMNPKRKKINIIQQKNFLIRFGFKIVEPNIANKRNNYKRLSRGLPRPHPFQVRTFITGLLSSWFAYQILIKRILFIQHLENAGLLWFAFIFQNISKRYRKCEMKMFGIWRKHSNVPTFSFSFFEKNCHPQLTLLICVKGVIRFLEVDHNMDGMEELFSLKDGIGKIHWIICWYLLGHL
jgi:hypothetical protein